MSSYQNFVREHIRSAPGATQKEKMRAVAAMWRKQKGGGGEAAEKPKKTHLFKGGAADRPRAVAPAAPSKSLLTGGAVNPLGAANQLGNGLIGDLFPPARLLGLGTGEQEGEGISFGDVMDGIGSVFGVASKAIPFLPLIL